MPVLAAVGVGVWALFFRDGADPIPVEEVVASAGPGTGVYVYRTEGFEETDALLGSRHDYPAETAIEVRAAGCGVVLRWVPLRQRSWTRELCANGELRRFEEVHSFFGTRDVQDYRCPPGTPAPPVDGTAGATWTSRCASADRVETARCRVVGHELVTVGGRRVEAVRLREEVRLGGTTEGTGLREWWLDPRTGLVLRLRVENDSVTETAIGGVGYKERYDLVLTSLEPRR